MSAHDSFEAVPSTPSPAPRSIGSSLHFARPARGKKSNDHLRKAASNASMRQRTANADMDSDSAISNEDEISRAYSPAPSALSAGNTSHIYLPEASREGGLELASEALQRLMEDAHSGSFAAGALGQKLLDQQEHMRQLMQQLEELSEQEHRNGIKVEDGTSSASRLLLEQVQKEITQMKQEQEDLVRELLQASNTDMGAIGVSATTRAEAEAIIHSYGGMPESHSYNSLSATPTKPVSSNARELRRQRNAAAPNLNKDEGFVNDIQSQLINELRRLQALVAERDKTLAAMSEGLEEASRFKAMQEANIKKLETEKDAKDAHLYEAERKEAMIREEHEDVVRQLKKYENEVRLLRKQLNEKTDAAESLKVTNEDLEQRIEETLGNVATLRAKGAADQMTINGLKTQVGDLEVKQRQAMDKIQPSLSNLSNILSNDHASMDSMHSKEDLMGSEGGPAGRRSGAYDQALTPSASLDESMANRLRPNEAIKNMEADVAKWKSAALKYRKKWSDERRQTSAEGQRKEADYDDSTDEDEDAWMDEAAKTGEVRKRTTSTMSRIISSASSRKTSKTMGDAFGIHRYNKGSVSSSNAWQEEEEVDTPDRSFVDDDASSVAGSSTRGSMDGFDPHFADPTIRSGADSKAALKRRSIQTGVKSSPLARQLQLHHDSDEESSKSRDRPASIIYEPGALGDELQGLTRDADESLVEVDGEDSMMEDHRATMEAALAEQGKAHEMELNEKDELHQILLTQKQDEHLIILQEREATHLEAMSSKDDVHQAELTKRDGVHRDQLQVLQREQADTLTQLANSHSKANTLIHERHVQALATRDEQHEAVVVELQGTHEDKIKEATSRQVKQHEEAMTDARKRHAETLSKAREEAQATLVNAQREHKKLLEDREAQHKLTIDRLQSQHDRALMQKDQEHLAYVEDSETTNEMFYKAKDEAHQKAVAERNNVIQVKETEIITLKERLSFLENEAESLRQMMQSSETKANANTRALEEMQAMLQAEKDERLIMENKLTAVSVSSSRAADLDAEDDFEDALEASEGGHVPLSLDHSKSDADKTIEAVDMTRKDTTSSTGETDSVSTPVIGLLPLSSQRQIETRKETAAQTDDDMWAHYQQEQLSAIRPPSSMLEVDDAASTAGIGGILVLGGNNSTSSKSANAAPNGSAVQRPRDSISTFGGNRDEVSARTESPAPTMYTVGAITGHGQTGDWSRRPSFDSTYSTKAAGETVEGGDVIPPVPRIPDRSKPPVMAVPPPPSMPPPPLIPVKQQQNQTIPSLVTDNATDDDNHRPISPSLDETTVKTTNKLRVPPESTSRPSSRVSGPPPSAFTTRGSIGKVPRPSPSRVRTLSTEESKGRPMVSRRESDAASIASRGSVRRGHASVRAPSAQSFASDVTSEYSRMSGVSSRASDYNVDAMNNQSRGMIVGPGGQIVSTDPAVLHSITQTMIGDYLFKYTRRSLGRSGHSDRRHRRYFWVHPYTRTLYWTLQAPSEAVAAESVSKSAFIQDVLVVDDTNNSPPGLYHKSILVMTQAREVKITTPTREKHDLWVTALSYLVNRDNGTPAIEKAPSEWRQSISRAGVGLSSRRRSHTSGPGTGIESTSAASVSKRPSLLSPERNFGSFRNKNASVDEMDRDRTPRARGYSASQASVTQRQDTAAKEYLDQWEAMQKYSSRPASTKAASIVGGNGGTVGRQSTRGLANEMFGGNGVSKTTDTKYMTAEEMLEEDEENNTFEGLDNVRACCDGKHDVGALAHRSHQNRQQQLGRPRSNTATSSSQQSKKSKTRAEDGPLKLTGPSAPQLGPLNLNTMHATRSHNTVDSSAKAKNNSDWFPTNEFGTMTQNGNGRTTPVQNQSATISTSSPSAPSYTERITQIRNARQSGGNNPWFR